MKFLGSSGSIQPVILQLIGLLLLIVAFVLWAVFGIESPLFVGAALTLVAVGSGTSALITVKHEDKPDEYTRGDDPNETKESHHQSEQPLEGESRIGIEIDPQGRERQI